VPRDDPRRPPDTLKTEQNARPAYL
jgi:hypothetical protein